MTPIQQAAILVAVISSFTLGIMLTIEYGACFSGTGGHQHATVPRSDHSARPTASSQSGVEFEKHAMHTAPSIPIAQSTLKQSAVSQPRQAPEIAEAQDGLLCERIGSTLPLTAADWTRQPWKEQFGSQPRLPRDETKFWGTHAFRQRLCDYVRMHRWAQKSKDSTARFLVFNATNDGLGNKLLPFVSAFALSLVLNRTFVVDWPGRWPSTNPGHVREFLQPPIDDLQWHLEELGEAGIISNVPSGLSNPRWSELNMREPGATDEKMALLCEDYEEKWKSVDVLVIPGDQYFLPLISHNPRYAPLFHRWFEDGNAFGPIARFIARPSKRIQSSVAQLRSEMFSDYNIGLQIRTKEWAFAGTPTHEFFNAAKQLAKDARAVRPDISISVFVASDNHANRQATHAALREENVKVVYPSHSTDRNSVDGVRWAMIEILLLSNCDDLVVTGHSTFGASALGIGSLLARKVAKGKPGYHIATTTQPSPHFWRPMLNDKKEKTLECVLSDMTYAETAW